MSATDPTDPRYPPHRSAEEQALEVLRAHRQAAGYVPWRHEDNQQLRELAARQTRQAQEAKAVAEGLRQYRQKAMPRTAPTISQLADHLPTIHQITRSPEPKPPLVRADPELARMAVGLHHASELALWLVARHVYGKPGWATKDALFATLKTAGLINTRRSFNRTLQRGRGLFWNTAGERVYLRGYVKVSQGLTREALACQPDLVATNIPGVRDIYLKVEPEMGAFKAQVYAGWLAHRQDPKISRETLCRLFACSKDTLRNWEERLGGTIEVTANYAQTSVHPKEDDRLLDYLPGHSYCYVTRKGQIRFRWRQPNTYKTTNIRQHGHKGQSRKARTAAAQVAWFQPVEIWAAQGATKLPFDRSHREPKRYFESPKQLKRYLDRLEKKGQVGISPQTPRYIFRGRDRYDHGIWELSLDGEAHTTARERMSIKAEYRWWAGFDAHQHNKKAG